MIKLIDRIVESMTTTTDKDDVSRSIGEEVSCGRTIIGRLSGWDSSGHPLVTFYDGAAIGPVRARSTVRLETRDLNREVVLIFPDNDGRAPIVTGVVQPVRPASHAILAEADGERMVLTAEREIVLRCGASSITLTQAGKILINGNYLVSRASGTNRIKGGSVQIN